MGKRPSNTDSPNIEDWLLEKGIEDQSRAAAIKQSLAEQIGVALEEDGVSKAELARRMKTSRPAIDRLLDPGNQSVTLATLQKAAAALNRELQLELLGNWLKTSDTITASGPIPTVLVRSPAVSSRSKRSRVRRLVGTVFFEVTPEQITLLNEREIVELLRRLIAADLTDAGIPLRGSTVPAQIHIPDGGEDGRVKWSGGSNETEYLPSRLTIFQVKAGDPGPAGCKAEVCRKKPGAKPKLKPAILELLEQCGSYVVIIGKALPGQRIPDRKKAIRKGIEDAGGQPDNLASIEIYDANILSDWVNIHPSVALWLNEHQKNVHLSGFQTYEGWGRDDEISSFSFIDDGKERFVMRGPPSASESKPTDQALTFEDLSKDVIDFLSAPKRSLRIVGASGFGKSRLAYELFSLDDAQSTKLDGRSVVFAQYEDIKDRLGAIALDLANSGAATILIIDDCPDENHYDILAKAKREGSALRIVTTDVSPSLTSGDQCRVVELAPASQQLIEKIVERAATNVSKIDLDFVADLAQGFPRMAILGARALQDGLSALNPVDELVSRIIWGRKTENAEALRVIETLSLFSLVGIDREAGAELNSVASACGIETQNFRDHLPHFEDRGILSRKGDYVEVQLLPLAVRLGSNRIRSLGFNGLHELYSQVTPTLQLRLLRRLRWFDQIPVAQEFGRALLRQEIVSAEDLNTEEGSRLLDRVMHVDPNCAMDTLYRLLNTKRIDELESFSGGRRYVVIALETLVFNRSTFYPAATLLRRLGAAENENWSNNAAGAFEGLYKLYLSGTEADPTARLAVLDEGLKSENKSERTLCVNALGGMLDRHHFSRGGGREQMGSGLPMKDWHPQTGKDIVDFHLEGLLRLTSIACSNDDLAEQAKAKIAIGIRGLLQVANFFDQIRETILAVNDASGFWPEAIMAIGDWLYFDRKGVPPEYASRVRDLYDELLDVDVSDRIVLFTKGWQTDLHDPDITYVEDDDHDWHYAENQARLLAEQVSDDQSVLPELLQRLTKQAIHGVYPFAQRLAQCSKDRVGLMKLSLQAVADRRAEDIEFRFFAGLVSGIDTESHADALDAIELCLLREDFGNGLVSIVSGAKIDSSLLEKVIGLVNSGLVTPANAASLSFGRGLDHFDPGHLSPFLDGLMAVGPEGVWAALEAVSMYQHGRDALSEAIAESLKKVLIAPGLFSIKPRTNMGTHHLKQAVKLLVRHGYLNSQFARSLAEQMISLASVEDYKVQLELDDAAQEILELTIADYPEEVWSVIQNELENEDALASHRMSGLLGIDKSAADGVPLLHGLPASVYLDWMEQRPKERLAIVLGWIPITTKSEEGKLVWHPDLEEFVRKYISQPEDLDIVGQRLYPSGWSGSLADQLEPYRKLVRTWRDHPVPAVRQWAHRAESGLASSILNERRRDANDDVRFFE